MGKSPDPLGVDGEPGRGDSPIPPDASVQPGDAGVSPPATGEPETDGEAEAGTGPRRPPGGAARVVRVVALAVGVIFIAAVGYAVVDAFSGGGVGDDNPEDVVEAMAAAASREDTIGMLALLPPSEVGTFAELYPSITRWAVQKGHFDNEDWLAGVDIDISGLDTEATYLHPDVAIVELRAGTLSVTVDPDIADSSHVDRFGREYSRTLDELLAELQDTVREGSASIAEYWLGDLFELHEPDGIYVMTVRREGRWYLSPFYSVAEFARHIADLPQADFEASRADAKPGAESASAVIGNFVGMLNSHRLEDYLEAETIADIDGQRSPLNAFVPPDEIGVLLDYAVSYRAWLDRINETDQPENLWQIIDSLGLEIRGEIFIDVDTREQPRPDGAVVLYLSSGSISATAEVTVIETGEVQPWEIEMSWDGLCATGYALIYDDYEDFESCVEPEDWPGDDDELFIVVRRVDGDWYVSYVETALAYVGLFLDDYLNDADDAGAEIAET